MSSNERNMIIAGIACICLILVIGFLHYAPNGPHCIDDLEHCLFPGTATPTATATPVPPTAYIDIYPQIKPVTSLISFSARPGQAEVDAQMLVIPAYTLTSQTETASISVKATGQSCNFIIWLCHAVVTDRDVTNAEESQKATLEEKINGNLQSQETTDFVLAGPVQYINDPAPIVNPGVGAPSDYATVVVTMHGVQEYVKNTDIDSLAAQNLQLKAQSGGCSITGNPQAIARVGEPDATGNVTGEISAAVNSVCSISQHDSNSIPEEITGKSREQAILFITQQYPDIASADIEFSGGDTLPTDPKYISVNSRTPLSLPPVNPSPFPSDT